MMTSVVPQPSQEIPPHFLLVGKKSTLDYIAPALFRIGTFGELVVRAKGSFSIVTAVDVAEMVKRDVPGLQTLSISIGTEEFVIEGTTRRVSYIEIHLSKAKPAPALPAPDIPALVSIVDAPPAEMPVVLSAPAAEIPVTPPKTKSRKKAAAKKGKAVKKKVARKKASA